MAPPPRRRHPGRLLAILGLVLATMAAGGWYFVLRDQAANQDEFVTAATRYVDAGNALLATIDSAHTHPQVDDAAGAVQLSSAVMAKQVIIFQRIARNDTGRSAQIAETAATAAQDGVTAQADLYDTVHLGRIISADQAREKLTTAMAAVHQAITDWQKL